MASEGQGPVTPTHSIADTNEGKCLDCSIYLDLCKSLEVAPKSIKMVDQYDLNDEVYTVEELKKQVKLLHSAYIGSRVELRSSFQESTSHQKRTMEQQAQIENLTAKLSKLSNELSTASGSAGERNVLDADGQRTITYHRFNEEAGQ